MGYQATMSLNEVMIGGYKVEKEGTRRRMRRKRRGSNIWKLDSNMWKLDGNIWCEMEIYGSQTAKYENQITKYESQMAIYESQIANIRKPNGNNPAFTWAWIQTTVLADKHTNHYATMDPKQFYNMVMQHFFLLSHLVWVKHLSSWLCSPLSLDILMKLIVHFGKNNKKNY